MFIPINPPTAPPLSRLLAGEAGRVPAQSSGWLSGHRDPQRPPSGASQPGPRPVQPPGCCHEVHPQHLRGSRQVKSAWKRQGAVKCEDDGQLMNDA